MSIRKHENGIWYVSFTAPDGERVRCSAQTRDRKAAQEYHDRLRAGLWRRDKLGEEPDRFFEEAAVRFLTLCQGQADYATKKAHIAYFRDRFAGRAMRSLTSAEILDSLPTHKRVAGHAVPVKNGTKNKYLDTIRRLLNLCVEWGWIDRAPKLARFEVPRVRVRWEPPQRIAALIEALSLDWVRDAAIVAVCTGMRESELFGLRVEQVNLGRRYTWVTHEAAKSKRGRTVPLNDSALAVLGRRASQAKDAGCPWVFTRDGGDGRRIEHHDKRVFKRACAAVGIEDFHWHDLRHTWASWHVQGVMNGTSTPLMVLQKLGGWETIQMVQRYAHLAPSQLADYAGNVKILANRAAPDTGRAQQAQLVA